MLAVVEKKNFVLDNLAINGNREEKPTFMFPISYGFSSREEALNVTLSTESDSLVVNTRKYPGINHVESLLDPL
ncbi:unnamed protein product [Ceratitis capitata]|uniref:(Mediterranean fruit fly) hypothetical protein n=1 Tax=Ceratitis capitata TaxID=7213 RepID=A0A811UGM0_CERCA|nr:unnamed protein product [Ceratitis capitata]